MSAIYTTLGVCVNFFLFIFIIAAITESYKKISQGLNNQKYLALAKILYQNGSIFNRKSAFKETRYTVKMSVSRIEQGDDVDQELRQWKDLSNIIAKNIKT